MRANSDDGAVHQTGTAEGVTVKLENIEWLNTIATPCATFKDYKIRMLRQLERQKSIKIAFRS